MSQPGPLLGSLSSNQTTQTISSSNLMINVKNIIQIGKKFKKLQKIRENCVFML